VLGEDGEEVADVVAAVTKGRVVEREHPDAVDAQPLEVVELLGEAAQVAGTVVAGVVEAPHQGLVEDRPLEPAIVGRKAVLSVHVRPSSQTFYGDVVTWFDERRSPLRCAAYFSPEFVIAETLPQCSRAPGVLAGEHLKAAARPGDPLAGVGLVL